MICHYEEKAGGVAFSDATVVAPFVASFVSIRWVSGAAPNVLEFSFDGTTTHGKIMAPASPAGAHPHEVILENEGESKVYLKGAAVTVAVRLWR